MSASELLLSKISEIYRENAKYTRFTRQKTFKGVDILEHRIKALDFNLISRRMIMGLFKPEKYILIIDNNRLISELPATFVATNSAFARATYDRLSQEQACTPLNHAQQNALMAIIQQKRNSIQEKTFTKLNPAITYFTLCENGINIVAHNDLQPYSYGLILDFQNPGIILPAHYNSRSPQLQINHDVMRHANNFAHEIYNLMYDLHVR